MDIEPLEEKEIVEMLKPFKDVMKDKRLLVSLGPKSWSRALGVFQCFALSGACKGAHILWPYEGELNAWMCETTEHQNGWERVEKRWTEKIDGGGVKTVPITEGIRDADIVIVVANPAINEYHAKSCQRHGKDYITLSRKCGVICSDRLQWLISGKRTA